MVRTVFTLTVVRHGVGWQVFGYPGHRNIALILGHFRTPSEHVVANRFRSYNSALPPQHPSLLKCSMKRQNRPIRGQRRRIQRQVGERNHLYSFEALFGFSGLFSAALPLPGRNNGTFDLDEILHGELKIASKLRQLPEAQRNAYWGAPPKATEERPFSPYTYYISRYQTWNPIY